MYTCNFVIVELAYSTMFIWFFIYIYMPMSIPNYGVEAFVIGVHIMSPSLHHPFLFSAKVSRRGRGRTKWSPCARFFPRGWAKIGEMKWR